MLSGGRQVLLSVLKLPFKGHYSVVRTPFRVVLGHSSIKLVGYLGAVG